MHGRVLQVVGAALLILAALAWLLLPDAEVEIEPEIESGADDALSKGRSA